MVMIFLMRLPSWRFFSRREADFIDFTETRTCSGSFTIDDLRSVLVCSKSAFKDGERKLLSSLLSSSPPSLA